MARSTVIDTHPRLLPANLAAQLVFGNLEHAVDHRLDHAIDLSRFDARFRNDTTGAPAYPPAVPLKVVLCAYARRIVSSRAIARLCENHATFIALCRTRTAHFATIAAFVSGMGAGFERQAERLEAAAVRMLARHQATDATYDGPPDPPDGLPTSQRARDAARLARLERDAALLRAWLAAHPTDRRSAKGAVRLSNRTDPDSAKMATGKGGGAGQYRRRRGQRQGANLRGRPGPWHRDGAGAVAASGRGARAAVQGDDADHGGWLLLQ